MIRRTHEQLDPRLCGAAIDLQPGQATVELVTVPEMSADHHGLVHGGFVFGLADHAAMLAINHPNVVLAAATVHFDRPVRVGAKLTAHAVARPPSSSKKSIVDVRVADEGRETVFRGELICISPDKHILADKRAEEKDAPA